VPTDRVAQAEDDADLRWTLRNALVAGREIAGLTHSEIAQLMGVKGYEVRDFEDGRTDPRLSFFQRYARALGWELRTEVTRDA